MSFATETKNELARIMPEKTCCELAEIAGFMRFAGSIGLAGLGKFKIVMTTPNIAVVRHYKKLIKDYFDVDIAIDVGRSEGFARNSRGAKANEYALTIGPENNSEMILREAGILIVRGGMNAISDGIYDGLIKTKCCRKAYLRGAFLAKGTVNSPEKGYHFEIIANTENQAKDLRRLLNTFVDISAKTVERKKGFGVYLKSREQIADTLAIMGASKQYFDFLDVIMRKDLMSQAHRAENLDLANVDKAVKAASAQIDSINKIIEKRGLDYLTPKLQEVALARLDNPDIGIEELGKIMDPPLSKSGVNNRLRKITEIAKGL